MTIPKNSNLLPAVCKIFFAPLEDVESILTSPDRFHRFIYWKDGKSWQGIYLTPGSAEFNEKPKDTDAGELIEQSLKFLFPGDDESSSSALDLVLGRPVLVKIEYTTGGSKLLGQIGNGAKLTQTGQISSKAAGSQLEFTCSATYRACWISS
jgi:hypothetical protein